MSLPNSDCNRTGRLLIVNSVNKSEKSNNSKSRCYISAAIKDQVISSDEVILKFEQSNQAGLKCHTNDMPVFVINHFASY